MQFRMFLLSLALLLFTLVAPGQAQEDSSVEADIIPLPVAAQVITIEAHDGLDLIADFYLVDPARPTVILLHEIYTDRDSWDALLLPLLANGYNVLVPDIRGGWGETRGAINWFKAVEDVATWFAWLREVGGVNPDAIHTMGSSMGSTLAIVGCGNDATCRSAIGLSPGWNYYRIRVADAITAHPMLVIYAERDRYPALGVPRMEETAPETVTVIRYDGNAHGMNLFADEQETMVVHIIEWLNAH